MRGLILAAALAFALSGCATRQSVADAPINAGMSRDFEAPMAGVREAARQTLQSDMPVAMTSVSDAGGVYTFEIEIGINAFNWGEVGRVVVVPVDEDTTRVSLYSEKRYQLQVTGQGERRLAEQLFAGIQRRLPAAE